MTIHARCQTNLSKQATLLDGFDDGPSKQCLCWHGLKRSVHEAMNNISNVKVHFKTRSGNVNITLCMRSAMLAASQLPGKGPTDVADVPAPAR